MKTTILKKLLVMMLTITIIPLAVLGFFALEDSKSLGLSAAEDARMLGELNLQAATDIGNISIADSMEALDDKSIKAIELRAYETAQRIAEFLRERENDVLYAASLERDAESYTRFLETKSKEVWETPDKKTDRPIYSGMTFINLDGIEALKVVYDSSVRRFISSQDLVDVSIPSNTEYKTETCFSEAQKLSNGEVYLSDLLGWSVSVNEAFKGQDKPDGERYEGIYRWLTPVYDGDKKVGYLMLAMDQEHINQFVDNIDPMGSYKWANPASTGNYAYIIAHDSWVSQHPNDFYIRGFLSDGTLAEGYGGAPSPDLADKVTEEELLELEDRFLNPTQEELERQKAHSLEQKQKGFIPLYGAWLTFSTGPGFPYLVFMNLKGEHGSNIYVWEGKTKFVAMSTIMYGREYGDNVVNLDSRAGFGFVGMGANMPDFHGAATKIAEKIEVKTNVQASVIKESIEKTEERIRTRTEDLGTQNTIFLITLATIFVVAVTSFLFAKSISDPITKLKDAADKVTSGDFDTPLPEVKGNDEVAELTASLEMLIAAFKMKSGKT
ncbi:MAG: HAMP domain-containing protein [Candidatus Altiarchaeota archaeon]|nr:HAMP domain-containing protein [Candidatus Altiarchaeota archaeon]